MALVSSHDRTAHLEIIKGRARVPTFLIFLFNVTRSESSACFCKIEVNYQNTFAGAVAQMDRAEVS
jgi:hypothetical protein